MGMMGDEWNDVPGSLAETTIRMEQPDFARSLMKPSGGVEHDERGNARWRWTDSGVQRLENLGAAALDLADAPTEVATLPKSAGRNDGYDPYGQTLPGRPSRRANRTDLRELSRQILQQRKARSGDPG